MSLCYKCDRCEQTFDLQHGTLNLDVHMVSPDEAQIDQDSPSWENSGDRETWIAEVQKP